MKLPNYHHDIHLCWQTLPLELGLFWVHEPAHVFGLWVVWRQGSEAYISLIYGIYINSCELCREVGNRASVSSAGWPTQFHNRDNLHQDLLPLPQRTLSFCQPVFYQCFFWCYVLLAWVSNSQFLWKCLVKKCGSWVEEICCVCESGEQVWSTFPALSNCYRIIYNDRK